MTVNAQTAWETAERRCFDYLLKELQGKEGSNAFLGDMPPVFGWSFWFAGGGEQFRPHTAPRCCWRMEATLDGVFSKRSHALQVIGLMMDKLPNRDIEGVQLLDLRETNPSLTPEVENIANKGDVRVWKVDAPLLVVFNNTTQ